MARVEKGRDIEGAPRPSSWEKEEHELSRRFRRRDERLSRERESRRGSCTWPSRAGARVWVDKRKPIDSPRTIHGSADRERKRTHVCVIAWHPCGSRVRVGVRVALFVPSRSGFSHFRPNCTRGLRNLRWNRAALPGTRWVGGIGRWRGKGCLQSWRYRNVWKRENREGVSSMIHEGRSCQSGRWTAP